MLEKTKGIIKNGQSKDIGNFGHTRHRTKTHKQTGIQDTERRQTNGHARHRTKTNKRASRHRTKTNKKKTQIKSCKCIVCDTGQNLRQRGKDPLTFKKYIFRSDQQPVPGHRRIFERTNYKFL